MGLCYNIPKFLQHKYSYLSGSAKERVEMISPIKYKYIDSFLNSQLLNVNLHCHYLFRSVSSFYFVVEVDNRVFGLEKDHALRGRYNWKVTLYLKQEKQFSNGAKDYLKGEYVFWKNLI